jgi:carboxyl-terminal processing protease
MIKNNIAKKLLIYSVVLVSLSTAACKKTKTAPAPVSPPVGTNLKQTPTTNRAELTNDSLYLYAKEIYFWNQLLPSYDAFEPRKYGEGLSAYRLNLYNLVKSSGSQDYNSAATAPNNRFSYIEDITTRNPQGAVYVPKGTASVDLEGNGNDVGIRPIFFLTSNTTRAYALYITAVYPGSDAAAKGVKRGWLITKVNGQEIGANYEAEAGNVLAGINGASVKLDGFKYESGLKGEAFAVTLTKTSYKSSPIYINKVLTAGTKKIGYLAYARFSDEANSVQKLNEAFDSFSAGGVTDLVIDLRYNGGGYISTAEHLINLIAPSTATGTMYVEHFNEDLKKRKTTDPSILKNQPLTDGNDKIRYDNGRMLTYADVDYSVANNTAVFKKTGPLTAIQNVVFIVSGSSASASELVINSLKPKMNVKLVGETTYGKPIGFFPIRLENKYDVFYSLFETKNSLGVGGYYTGMVPDYAENANEPTFWDDPRYDFGDKSERYLAKAISVLNPTGLPVTGMARTSVVVSDGNVVTLNSNTVLKKPAKQNDEFVGMIENRHKTKK